MPTILIAVLSFLVFVFLILLISGVVSKKVLSIPDSTKIEDLYEMTFIGYTKNIDQALIAMYKSPETSGAEMSFLKNAFEAENRSHHFDFKTMRLTVIWSKEEEESKGYKCTIRGNFKFKIKMILTSLSALYLFLLSDLYFKKPPVH